MRPALLVGPGLAALLGACPCRAEGDCGGFKWPVGREQAGFAAAALPSVASGSPLPGASQPVVLTLSKQDAVSFPVAPSRKPKGNAPFAGVYPLSVATAGTYQVTLSGDAWVEVAQGGKLLKEIGFTGSHTCPTVHKSVRFDLAAGPATVEISDAGADTIKVDVVPKE